MKIISSIKKFHFLSLFRVSESDSVVKKTSLKTAERSKVRGLVKSNTNNINKAESKKPSPKKVVETSSVKKVKVVKVDSAASGQDNNSVSGRRVSTRSKKPGGN